MGRVANKVAIVTGGASGMGRAHSLVLAKEGAHVVVTDLNEHGGRETVEQIEAERGIAQFIRHDVSSESDWKRVVTGAVSAYGNVNVLVNNAGISIHKATVETTLEQWDAIQNVNIRGTFLGCREVIPTMKAAGGGSIVNVSSSWAIVGRAGFAAYCASKGAVRALTKALAAELAEFNIRVNSLHPGTIETNLTKPVLTSQAAIDFIIGPQPIRRVGSPMEVAMAMLLLASDEAPFMTGTEIVVDGGYVSV